MSDLFYLILVCNFIPMSVISNSGLSNFDGYAIVRVRYIVFRAPDCIDYLGKEIGNRESCFI